MKNNYSLGFPSGDYDSLLKMMSSTSVHSSRTSSIPLADFWYPGRNQNLKEIIFKVIGISSREFDDATKSFEYPTKAFKIGYNGSTIQYSGPSMSDMMIDSDSLKITIEAKYTEYVKKDSCQYSPLIGEWKRVHQNNPSRLAILNCWRRYIGLDPYLSLEDSDKDNSFPYQFLHRAASACFNAKTKNKVLLYQLFYDEETKDSLDAFENNLSLWSKELKLEDLNLHFVIAEIQIDTDKSLALSSKDKGNLFLKMIDHPQYEFGSITCKNGYSLDII